MGIVENICGPSVDIYVTLYDKPPQLGLKWIDYHYEWNIKQNKAKKTFSQVHNQCFPDIVFVKEAEHLKTFVYGISVPAFVSVSNTDLQKSL